MLAFYVLHVMQTEFELIISCSKPLDFVKSITDAILGQYWKHSFETFIRQHAEWRQCVFV